MATYAVGDLQGCYDELRILLDTVRFDPTQDTMWFVGDLISRGPKSLATLRFVKSMGTAAVCVLGNHDIHLLALALTDTAPLSSDHLGKLMNAKDRDELIDWLRHRPLAHYDESLNTLMVHAGVIPQWTAENVMQYAHEVEKVLQGKRPETFLRKMYGENPQRWSDELTGTARLRFIINCLTRLRFLDADGGLNFSAKQRPDQTPANLYPWFAAADRATANTRIVFGHWSALGLMVKPGLLALDTGCVWGGALTGIRLDGRAAPIAVPSLQPKRF